MQLKVKPKPMFPEQINTSVPATDEKSVLLRFDVRAEHTDADDSIRQTHTAPRRAAPVFSV